MSTYEEHKKKPIFIQAELLFKLVESFVNSLPEEDDYIQSTKFLMMEDVMIIPAKIMGAEGGDLYSIRMQNAAIIREHAMHLYTHVGSFRFHETYKDLEYVNLIRKEITTFRLLFIDWVASFDTTNHIWDDWGLFNPAGAIPPSEEEADDDDDFNIDFFDFDEDDE